MKDKSRLLIGKYPSEDTEEVERRKKFEARQDESLRKAEEILGLPSGAIVDIRKDTDYIAVMKTHATIEPLLKDTLRAYVKKKVSHPKVAFDGSDHLVDLVGKQNFDEQRKLALKFGLINEHIANYLFALSTMRNYYAHHIANCHLTIPRVLGKIEKNGQNIKSKFYGINVSSPLAEEFISRMALVNGLAFYLDSILEVLDPPRLGDLIGGLLDSIEKGRSTSPD